MNRRVLYDIPMYIHNFRGYDSHLIVTSMSEHGDRVLAPIGQNMEKYLQLKWGKNMVFRDSFQHMSSSLEALVESLRKTDERRFTNLQTVMNKHYRQVDHKLLLRKGVFPYEYVDSFERLDEQQLPPREAFFSRLRGEEISEADYDYAQQVWTAFGCRTLKDYLELYLRSDVCLLADVFQNYRTNCKAYYDLDPAYFVSAPQLSWNAMFKSLKLKLELISDQEMFLMISPHILGGFCHACVRYAKAYNM